MTIHVATCHFLPVSDNFDKIMTKITATSIKTIHENEGSRDGDTSTQTRVVIENDIQWNPSIMDVTMPLLQSWSVMQEKTMDHMKSVVDEIH